MPILSKLISICYGNYNKQSVISILFNSYNIVNNNGDIRYGRYDC